MSSWPGIGAAEAYWHDRPVDGVPPGCLPWIPYPAAEFLLLLETALPVVPVATFLDVGCGIGTKCMMAVQHGLAAAGVEIVPAYIAEACRRGVHVFRADARTWDGYGGCWGVVYVNHPLAGDADEAVLERRIQAEMPPGSVLITVNSAAPPAWPVLARAGDADLAAVKP